jgi:3-methyladenine DNA glycosylase/8-oxoguanine DNA glycosylase
MCCSRATSHFGGRPQHAYGLDHLPAEEEMVRIAQPWRPYRSLAVNYLFAYELDSGP